MATPPVDSQPPKTCLVEVQLIRRPPEMQLQFELEKQQSPCWPDQSEEQLDERVADDRMKEGPLCDDWRTVFCQQQTAAVTAASKPAVQLKVVSSSELCQPTRTSASIQAELTYR